MNYNVTENYFREKNRMTYCCKDSNECYKCPLAYCNNGKR